MRAEEERPQADGAIVLELSLFKAAAEGYFHKPNGGEPAYSVTLGNLTAALPLDGIRKEFQIAADSADGRMLSLIERALDFVTMLRLGDALPSEVLTGEPSWDITAEHRLRAHQRLTVQLVTWITGEERVVTSAAELNQIAEDPNNKRKWNQAFDEAARRLGFETDGRSRVMTLIASLAEEIAFIEALRDRYESLLPIERSVQAMRRLYARENSVRETADAVARLIGLAFSGLGTSFAEIDAQTGEILSALKKPDQLVSYVRAMRDDLHCRLFVWSSLAARWTEAPMRRDESNVTLLRDSYRFLAQRYMPVDEWVRIMDAGAGRKKKKKKTTEMVW